MYEFYLTSLVSCFGKLSKPNNGFSWNYNDHLECVIPEIEQTTKPSTQNDFDFFFGNVQV